ncbi:MAG: hypothetical protein ACPGSN_10215, partial [Psychrobium sp.]
NRATVTANEKFKTIKMVVTPPDENGNVVIQSNDPSGNETEERMHGSLEGTGITTAINASYLMQALQEFEKDGEITIIFDAAGRFVVKDDDYLAVMMPVKV